MNEVSTKELVSNALDCGSAIGQAALAEYILKEYGSDIPQQLKRFLHKVSQSSYETIGGHADKPAEDIGLKVSEIMALKLG